MKLTMTAIIIASLAGMTFLGIFGINCDADGCGSNAHRWCFAAQAEATPCPGANNAALFLNFHLEALSVFSSAAFGEYAATAFAATMMIVFMVGLKQGRNICTNPILPVMAYLKWLDSEQKIFPSRIKFYRWLSLRQTNPAHS